MVPRSRCGRARVLHMPGADANDNAGDRTYLVLAKPNVIMNDTRHLGVISIRSISGPRTLPFHVGFHFTYGDRVRRVHNSGYGT